MASAGPFLGGDDRAIKRCRGSRPGAVGESGGGTQPVRGRGSPLAGGCVLRASPATAIVYLRLGDKYGVALPAFERRGAPADQMDCLRRLICGPVVSDQHG